MTASEISHGISRIGREPHKVLRCRNLRRGTILHYRKHAVVGRDQKLRIATGTIKRNSMEVRMFGDLLKTFCVSI